MTEQVIGRKDHFEVGSMGKKNNSAFFIIFQILTRVPVPPAIRGKIN